MISLHGRGCSSCGRCLLLWAVCVLLSKPELSAQESREGLSPFEVRMVWEVNRHSLEGTLGYSFLREREGTMRVEFGVLTVPFAGVSGTYFLSTGEHLKVGPELGLLLTPVASSPPFCPSAGLLIAYRPRASSVDILAGIRAVWVPAGSGHSLGGSLPGSRSLDLVDFPPLVIFLGIAL